MSRSDSDLATEITVAWLHAVGEAAKGIGPAHVNTAKSVIETLTPESVTTFYEKVFKKIKTSYNS